MALILGCEANISAENDKPLHDKPEEEVYYPKEKNSVRLVSYNVGVFSKELGNSTQVVAAMMKELETDIMVLNELDKNNDRHNVDQLAEFAKIMDWNSNFGKFFDYRNGEFGSGMAYSMAMNVIDKFIIPLPQFDGDRTRCCIVLEFEDFIYAGTHLGAYQDPDRIPHLTIITEELQTKYAGKSKPVFLGGDMNSLPDDAVLATFENNWNVLTPKKPTFPAKNPTKCIDYIFALKDASQAFEVTASGVCDKFNNGDVKIASDHLPIYVDIRITK